MIEYPKGKDFQQAKLIGTWVNTSIPIYDVPSMHSLNQLVGYVKHINAGNGTVLYRGQCQLYPSVSPSIMRKVEEKIENDERLSKAIEAIASNPEFLKFFGLKNSSVDGWILYQNLVIEAALQHYGANTYCVDFVDNHWTALWFGLYKWDSKSKIYAIRSNSGDGEDDRWINKSVDMNPKPYPPEPEVETIILQAKEIRKLKQHSENASIAFAEIMDRAVQSQYRKQRKKWEQECLSIKMTNDEIDRIEKADHLFLFLYVADTNGSNMNGVYFGKQTYTIDLRKALPSTFLRPCSQHGWVVKGKLQDYDFNEDIACVIRVSVDLAREMLGSGTLLTQENFFPDESIDQGYNILLQRQIDSRLKTKFNKVIPKDMITDFGPRLT